MTRAAATAALCLGASLSACARKPTLVTQPAAVVIDSTTRGGVIIPAPHPRRAYPNYWSAINDANFDAAHALANGREQRAFADALATLADGRLAIAESATVQLLDESGRVLGTATEDGGAQRALDAASLEVAVLDRTRPRRAFRRLTGATLEDLLAAGASGDVVGTA